MKSKIYTDFYILNDNIKYEKLVTSFYILNRSFSKITKSDKENEALSLKEEWILTEKKIKKLIKTLKGKNFIHQDNRRLLMQLEFEVDYYRTYLKKYIKSKEQLKSYHMKSDIIKNYR